MCAAAAWAGDDLASLREQQIRRARAFSVYDFEPRPDPIDSRDADYDGFPDYWRRIRLPTEMADYETFRIVEDPWRMGLGGARPGHVLYMTYSGEPVALETAIPKEVDAQLAYEISVFARTRGLDHSIASVDVYWLHIDEEGREQILGAPDQIVIPPGQRDWSEAPLVRRVNDLHRRTTHVRVVLRVRDNPRIPGADRHGEIWFDDIRILSRPKIAVAASFREMFRDDEQPLRIAVSYQGLNANVTVPGDEAPTRKRYARRIEVKDVHGNPVPVLGDRTAGRNRRRIDPGNSTTFTEEVTLEDRLRPGDRNAPRQRGIFYMDITLYGAENEPLAAVTEIVGRWAPPRPKPTTKRNPEALDHFAVRLDPLRLAGDVKDDTVVNLMQHLGVFRILVELWDETADGGVPEKKIQSVGTLLRRLRASGLRVTGSFGRMPTVLVPSEGMFPAMRERTGLLREAIRRPAMEFGPQIDDWRWGADDDESFSREVTPEMVRPAQEILQEYANAFTQALPLVVGDAEALPHDGAAETLSFFVPAGMAPREMTDELSRILPGEFTRLLRWANAIYPPEYMERFARNAQGVLEDKEASRWLGGEAPAFRYWLMLEPMPLDPHLREAGGERAQAMLLAQKAILGRVLGFERIYCGALADPSRGLVTVTRDRRLIPRPSFLAVRTLAEYLSGTEYLGSFQLGANVENYVFRSHANPERAILAAWRTGAPTQAERVDIGIGWGQLYTVDMAGNREALPGGVFTVGPMPVLVEGLNVKSARTRMSIRITDEPPLLSMTETQQQRLQIRNFHAEPLVGTVRLVYAAHVANERLMLEPGWSTVPSLRVSLPAGGESAEKRVEARRYFSVRPTQESVLGRKYVRLEVHMAAANEMRFNLIRTTRLTSDMAMRVKPLESTGRRNEEVVRLSVQWWPDPNRPHPSRLVLQPYYQVSGDRHIYQGQITVYPAKAPDDWTGAAIRDIRIPRVRLLAPNTRVWIGADEEAGTRFLRQDVTELVRPKITPE